MEGRKEGRKKKRITCPFLDDLGPLCDISQVAPCASHSDASSSFQERCQSRRSEMGMTTPLEGRKEGFCSWSRAKRRKSSLI